MDRVLVTGITGLVGSAFVAALLRERPNDYEVVCLVRSSGGRSAAQRVDSIIRDECAFDGFPEKADEILKKIQVVEGDVTTIVPEELAKDEKLRGVNIIFHCAADINLGKDPTGKVFRINYDGTKNMVALAKLLKVREFHYVGTAYVAGKLRGTAYEQAPVDNGFNNPYEESINTGELTHLIRQLDMNNSTLGYQVGEFAANHMAGIKSGLRVVLDVAHLAHVTLGPKLMTTVCRTMNKMGLPLWTTAMPKKKRQPKKSDLTQFIIEKSIPHPEEEHSPLKVVYFPSCINQTMGQSKESKMKHDLVDEVIQLMAKAGYEVIFPEGMEKMCCGQIWESKGMLDIADRKSAELEAALWKASEQGKYPVLCAQSPCLHRMKKVMKKMKLYEPAEFIMTYLVDRLDFHPTDQPIAIHLTCSTRQMGVDKDMIALAKMCSTKVLIPEGVGCCGFAGDRGFTFPELNKYGLRKLRPQIEANHIEVGYSNSRTCEIGLETNTGIPYLNIVYLVNVCTTAKKKD